MHHSLLLHGGTIFRYKRMFQIKIFHRFYGAEERIGENSMPQYIIVMSYIPLGTLTQFLKENTIDWFTLCRMYHSTASGLAHLHSDITKGGMKT